MVVEWGRDLFLPSSHLSSPYVTYFSSLTFPQPSHGRVTGDCRADSECLSHCQSWPLPAHSLIRSLGKTQVNILSSGVFSQTGSGAVLFLSLSLFLSWCIYIALWLGLHLWGKFISKANPQRRAVIIKQQLAFIYSFTAYKVPSYCLVYP